MVCDHTQEFVSIYRRYSSVNDKILKDFHGEEKNYEKSSRYCNEKSVNNVTRKTNAKLVTMDNFRAYN